MLSATEVRRCWISNSNGKTLSGSGRKIVEEKEEAEDSQSVNVKGVVVIRRRKGEKEGKVTEKPVVAVEEEGGEDVAEEGDCC